MRASETWRVVIQKQPKILEFFNAQHYLSDDFDIKLRPGQGVLSVSGYGEARPINEIDTSEARSENRRIDLRFIMMTPRSLKQADIIAEKIRVGVEGS